MFLSSISQTRGQRGFFTGNRTPWPPSNSAAVRDQRWISNVAEEASAVARVLALAHTSAYHPSLLQQRSAVPSADVLNVAFAPPSNLTSTVIVSSNVTQPMLA